MGLFDVFANVMTGGLYGLGKATGQAIAGATGQTNAGAPGLRFPSVGVNVPPPPGIRVPAAPAGPGVVVAPPAPAGGCGDASAPVASGGAPVTVQCGSDCCSYSVTGDYLLDARTGDVWLLDKQRRVMVPMQRQYSRLDSAAGAVNLALLREQMQQQAAANFVDLPHPVRSDVQKRFDGMMTVLDAQIADLHKAAGLK